MKNIDITDTRPIEVTETFTVDVTHTFTVPGYMEAALVGKDRADWLAKLYSGAGADKAWVHDHKVFIQDVEVEEDV